MLVMLVMLARQASRSQATVGGPIWGCTAQGSAWQHEAGIGPSGGLPPSLPACLPSASVALRVEVEHQPRNRWACTKPGPAQPQRRRPEETDTTQTDHHEQEARPLLRVLLPRVLGCQSPRRPPLIRPCCCRTGWLAGWLAGWPSFSPACNELPPKASSVAARFRRRFSSAKASHGRGLKRLAAQHSLFSPDLPAASRFLHFATFIPGPPFRASNLHTIGSLGWGDCQASLRLYLALRDRAA
ncbi:hypothetical protein J3F83DRAFT_53599 [Trichoderma novae-zelandiae]